MADRKAELEKKKAKLEQMRIEKIKKQELEKKKKEVSESDSKPKVASDDDINAILSGLGIPSTASATTSPRAESEASSEARTETGSVVNEPVMIESTPSMITSSKAISLGFSKVAQTSIPPKEHIAYNKETQTPTEHGDREVHPLDYFDGPFVYDTLQWEDEFHSTGGGPVDSRRLVYALTSDEEDSLSVDTPGGGGRVQREVQAASALAAEDMAKVTRDERAGEEQKKEARIRILTEQEREELEMSEGFQLFLSRTSRVVERTVTTRDALDSFIDYRADADKKDAFDSKEAVRVTHKFVEERWSLGRIVASLDWSPFHPELLLAGYGENQQMASSDPDGVALVWNLNFPGASPEFRLEESSRITSCCFVRFHPHLIVGGTYLGRICLWDNRVNKHTPVQRTTISSNAHTYPVFCAQVVGTQNAHNLISISDDGRMCTWTVDMLAKPIETLELQKPVKSMSLPLNDYNQLVVGADDNRAYLVHRHGSKTGVQSTFESHTGPVTSVHCHPVSGPVDFSNLFLTSSFDYTVKLWSVKEPPKPVYTFEGNIDYILDAQWSPVHPALFAAVDLQGRFDLWNLNNDTEMPTATTWLEKQANLALKRVRWMPSGNTVAIGDNKGQVHIVDINEHLSQPRGDEWNKFVQTVQKMKTTPSWLN